MIEKNYQKAFEKSVGHVMVYAKNDGFLYEDPEMTKKCANYETIKQLMLDGKIVIKCAATEDAEEPTYHRPSTFVFDDAAKEISMNGLTQTVTVAFA